MLTRLYLDATARLREARERLADAAGASGVEYAILVAVIALVVLAGATLLAPYIQAVFQRVADALSGA